MLVELELVELRQLAEDQMTHFGEAQQAPVGQATNSCTLFSPQCFQLDIQYMSLLRNAEKCFANQQAHKSLNAFVTTPHDGAWLRERTQHLQEADRRRNGGELTIYGTRNSD